MSRQVLRAERPEYGRCSVNVIFYFYFILLGMICHEKQNIVETHLLFYIDCFAP